MVWSAYTTMAMAVGWSIVSAYDHKELFPPNDEYDFEIFNEENLFGSPYGGFSRASRSRLAKLPLHLSDTSGFEFLEDNFGKDEDESEIKSSAISKSKVIKSKNAPHFNIRDGDGRQFACRVYKEEELTVASASSSMFDFAVESDEKNDNDGKTDKQTSRRLIDKAEVASNISLLQVLEERVFPNIQFDCLILKKGWWQYKWCDSKDVVQFHEDESSTTTHLLGNYVEKLILKTATEDYFSILQIFSDGEICDETGKRREMRVDIGCCTKEIHKSLAQKNEGNVVFHTVQEQKTCQYAGVACSPLLCQENIEKERLLMAENITEKMEMVDDISMEDASIREILKRTVGKRCLSKDAGWWVYEFCHLQYFREFHSTTYFDKKTGNAHIQVETEHSLGNYDEKNDAYENEDEINRMKNSPFIDESLEQNDFQAAVKKSLISFDTNQDTNNMNKAFFSQEYTNGDVCDHTDVTDAAIKGGTVANGGIERATTVRFSCGPSYNLVSVNEDSTCHYIIDVTVPELCLHPYFKTVEGSNKVVKCLPVQ